MGGGGIGRRAVLSRRCCTIVQFVGSNPTPPATFFVKESNYSKKVING